MVNNYNYYNSLLKYLFAITSISIVINLNISAQDIKNDTTIDEFRKYNKYVLKNSLEDDIKRRLKVYRLLIALRTHPQFQLDSIEYQKKESLLDSVLSLKTIHIVDSLCIVLTNGLSWDIRIGPPPAPKNFNIKKLTKRGRKDKRVENRLKYLQFCHSWEENNEIPVDLVEKFISYYSISTDKKLLLLMLYEIKLQEDLRTKVSKKEIIIN